jgi:Amt family ammonium transporter
VQTIGIAAAAAWSALATVALVKLVGAAVGVRVEAHDEYEGLDFASHGERAYDYGHSSARRPLRLMSREVETDSAAQIKKKRG